MATVEIRIRSLAQLFDPLDPSPLQQRALDPSVDRYIVACARELPPREPFHLLIYLPESPRAHLAEATRAIHEHFRRTHAQGERRFRRRLRVGGLSLGVGVTILAVSVGLRSLLRDIEWQALARGLAEGLLILGWVALWRPLEILLFEHWESHLGHARLERLAGMPVEFSFLSDEELQA